LSSLEKTVNIYLEAELFFKTAHLKVVDLGSTSHGK